MKDDNRHIRDAILGAALPAIPFDGWTADMLERAAVLAGHAPDMARAVFPRMELDAAAHFSDLADRRMQDALADTDSAALRVRDRIALAVRTRLEFLAPHQEAERLALALWVRPFRKVEGAKLVWKTADRIWLWAGDTATDYNHYTKRALLSGVLTSTILFWLNDATQGKGDTWGFLDRRIENALQLGKIAARVKKA